MLRRQSAAGRFPPGQAAHGAAADAPVPCVLPLLLLLVGLGASPISAIAQPGGARTVIVDDVRQAPAVVSVPLTGTVLARRVAGVSAQVAGYVSSVGVEVGDSVSAGDVLVRLDDRLARAATRAAEARIEQATAQLTDVQRQLDEAQALLEQQNVAATRYETLRQQVAQGRANLAALAAERDAQATRLDQHLIRAPFDGVIVARQAEVGEWLTPGVTVVDLREVDVVRVQTDVPQQLWSQVSVGTPAQLQFDAWPEQPRRAAVSIRIAAADAAARTFPVLFELDNRDRRLTPGMSARVGLEVESERGGETLQVPRDAVLRGPDGVTRVWVLRPAADGATVAPVTVTLGRSFGSRIEVIDGNLAAGDQVVVRGNETLRAGQQVRVVTELSGGA